MEKPVKFEYLLKTLVDTITTYDFFVDWNKVKINLKKVEKLLHLLNYLIGKENLKEEFFALLKEYPEVIQVFPILIAVRGDKIQVLNEKVEIEVIYFKKYKNLSNEEIEKYYRFFRQTGLEEIFKNRSIKNLVDYVFGIEVGLDTHARKNRVGVLMEKIVESEIKSLIAKYNYIDYIYQADVNKIKNKWNISIVIDKTDRKFDFAILNTKNNKLFLIEVNFYSGQGSKLKATAGEYISLNNFLREKNKNVEFIWITDGKGWLSVKNALLEAYNSCILILNLKAIKEGYLERILTSNID